MSSVRSMKAQARANQAAAGDAPPSEESQELKHRVVTLIETHAVDIERHLPQQANAVRMIALAKSTANRKRLAKCTHTSLFNAILDAVVLGLEPDTPLQLCHILPFWSDKAKAHEAKIIIGYRGFIQLAYRSPRVRRFSGHVAYVKDFFEYSYGFPAYCRHKPLDTEQTDPASYFSVAEFDNGGGDFEVMNVNKMERHRDRIPEERRSPAWTTHPIQMGCKTMVRLLAKRVPLTAALSHAIQVDENTETGEQRHIPVLIDHETGEIDDTAIMEYAALSN